MNRTAIFLSLALALAACQPTQFDDDNETGEDESNTSDSDGSSSSSSSGNTSGSPVVDCDPGEQDACPEGEKCTVLTSGADPVYECVPDDGSLLPFDPCTPAPGTGQDQCPSGFACIATEPEGSDGQCLELCLADNDCETALCTEPPGRSIPLCAPICDPLSPFCPDQQACQRVRSSAFVCQFPGESDSGITADVCDILGDRGCAEGFVCETGQIVPGCPDQSCCTALCDKSEAEPCPAPTTCGGLPLDPQPGLENVGACYVPQ